MDKKSQISAKQLMETVSFELERDLRLHPQKLELGKLELLTDSLKLPFYGLQKRLDGYVQNPNKREAEAIKLEIRSYLKRLNANPLIPLKFRLQVLDCLEENLTLFDDSITSSVLNSHKLAIEMVQEAARDKPDYYPVLVDMICISLELAIELFRSMLERYHSPSLMMVRQVLDMARLGLVVLPIAKDEELAIRLCKAVAHHELLRCMDCYSKTIDIQKTMDQEIRNYCDVIKPKLLRMGDDINVEDGDIYLVTNLAQPSLRPYKAASLPLVADTDMIIMPLGAFLEKIKEDYERALVIYKHPERSNDLYTEKRCHDIVHGVQAIRHALQQRKRQHPRGAIPGVFMLISGEATKGFARLKQKGRVIHEDSLGTNEKHDLWSLVNISKQGMMLERLTTEREAFEVGHLISLTWVGKKNYGTNIGHVRWIREIKHGEFRIGIEFFDLDCTVIRGAVIGRVDRINARSWHLLVENADENRVWFPETEVEEGMRFTQYLEGKGGIRSHITKVLEKHGNYTLCQVQQDAQEGMVLG